MAVLPVIDGAALVTLNWASAGGITPRNVMCWQAATGSWNTEEFFASFDGLLANDLWSPVHSDFELPEIAILPLDGTSPTVFMPLASGAAGGSSGEIVPPQAQVVSLRTGVRGPRGRGRIFFGPCGDSWADGGLAGSTETTNLQAAWTTFIAGMATASAPYLLMVLSRVHSVADVVINVECPQVMATQRRRQDQLR